MRLSTILLILLLLVVVVGLSSYTSEPRTRYFFIGYTSNEGTGAEIIKTYNGKFISHDKAIEQIRADQNILGQLVITSVHEFTLQDLTEYAQ